MVLAQLDQGTGMLEVANLGDAGLRVFRNGQVVLATTDQQYEFDMPYQMACREFVDMDYNTPADANTERFKVEVRFLGFINSTRTYALTIFKTILQDITLIRCYIYLGLHTHEVGYPSDMY
jgi:serine/threonine protein phosphatase PrpC